MALFVIPEICYRESAVKIKSKHKNYRYPIEAFGYDSVEG